MKISLSTEPAKQQLTDYIKQIDNYADYMHCDVMDGVFVEQKCFSVDMLKQANSVSTIPLDVHLMVANPLSIIPDYIKNGANIITIHYECFSSYKQIFDCIKLIHKNNCLAGIAINPDTFVDKIVPLFSMVDLVLVMSVVPGKSGQVFIPETIDKIKTINKYKKYNNYKFLIEVDGGVNDKNIIDLKNLNVDIVVSGNFVYKSTDRKQAIMSLKNN